MYPWVDYTWNPLAGRCPHHCSYCYMNRIRNFNRKYRGDIRLSENALQTDLGEERTIFVGSATDIFAHTIPNKLILKILTYCKQYDNTYLFQTKNPTRFHQFYLDLPEPSATKIQKLVEGLREVYEVTVKEKENLARIKKKEDENND